MTHVQSSGSHFDIPHPDLKSIRFDIFISHCHTQQHSSSLSLSYYININIYKNLYIFFSFLNFSLTSSIFNLLLLFSFSLCRLFPMAFRPLLSRTLGLTQTLTHSHSHSHTLTQLRGLQTFSLPDLSYDYGALEPAISGEIMQLHHQKHHQAYITNYNKALEQLEDALAKGDSSSVVKLQSAIKFNGGGLSLSLAFFFFVLISLRNVRIL